MCALFNMFDFKNSLIIVSLITKYCSGYNLNALHKSRSLSESKSTEGLPVTSKAVLTVQKLILARVR
jgi:hypothetical protein